MSFTLHDLGEHLREVGQIEEAEESLGRCLTIREARLGEGDWWVVATFNSLSSCARMAGLSAEAEETFEQCVEIDKAK